MSDRIVDLAIAAYRRAGARHKGFFYDDRNHVIRDLSKMRGEQVVWEREGYGADYEAAHEAMMEELERIKMRAAIAALRGKEER